MSLTAAQITWLQRNKAMSGGGSASVPPAAPPAAPASGAPTTGTTPNGAANTASAQNPAPGAASQLQAASTPQIMDEAWIVSFLTRHHFGSPKDADAPDDACVFDGSPSKVADVIKALDADAQTYGLAANANQENIVNDVLSQHRRGGIMGQQIAKHWQDGKDIGVDLNALQRQKMVAILDTMDALHGAKQLDPVLDIVRNQLHDPRLEIAILTVQHHIGGEWQALMDKLTDDADKAAIRGRLLNAIDAGDMGDVKPLTHGGTGYRNDDPDDNKWINGFLDFVHAGPDPQGDGTGRTCEFDGAATPLQRAVDTVVEQGALAGRMLDKDDVATALAKLAVQPKTAAGAKPGPQYSIQFAFPASGVHVDTKGQGSVDKLQSQTSYTGTFQLHPDGAAGPEIAWTVQVTATADKFVVQNILKGVQAQWVWPFLNGALQVQVIASALRGLANSGTDAKGKVAMVPMTQVGVAGQVTYAIFGQTVLVGFQLQGSGTATGGMAPTADLVPMAFIQIQWK
jgi:hypothetical protein